MIGPKRRDACCIDVPGRKRALAGLRTGKVPDPGPAATPVVTLNRQATTAWQFHSAIDRRSTVGKAVAVAEVFLNQDTLRLAVSRFS